MQLKTADEVRKVLDQKGVTVSAWARANGLEPKVVYEVLAGRHKGARGEARRASVLLGIRNGELTRPGDEKTVLAEGAK